jgi:hypothetical protein
MSFRFFVPVLAIALTGCGDLPSVEPLATPENTIFDPALIGAWSTGDAVIISQKDADQSYRISWIATDSQDAPRVVRMEGRLAQVGDRRILDLTSSNPGAFAIQCHVFLLVTPVTGGLKVSFIDSKWIRGLVKNSLESFTQGDHPVITAPSAKIAAFLLQFGFDARALDEPMMLRPLKRNR